MIIGVVYERSIFVLRLNTIFVGWSINLSHSTWITLASTTATWSSWALRSSQLVDSSRRPSRIHSRRLREIYQVGFCFNYYFFLVFDCLFMLGRFYVDFHGFDTCDLTFELWPLTFDFRVPSTKDASRDWKDFALQTGRRGVNSINHY